jgi:hypothetical protein
VRYLLLLLVSVLLFSCGETADEVRHDSIEQSKDSLRELADRKDRLKKCCFQSADEFSYFFPDTLGEYVKQRHETQLLCNDDTLAHNTSLVYFANAGGHLITVRLTEYCTSPSLLASDWAMKYGMHKSTAEFNEFDVPASHHGFSTFDARKSTAYLIVEVDDRFLVEITDQVCKNTQDLLNVYEHLPLAELAKLGK